MEAWNKKIGVVVADDIGGEFVCRYTPLLEPCGCDYWDCTITTNSSPTKSGLTTYGFYPFLVGWNGRFSQKIKNPFSLFTAE